MTLSQNKASKFKPLPVHPAAEIIPLMEDAEFTQLVNDIKAHGLHDAITTIGEGDDKQLLEGRHRERACIEAGIKPRYTKFEGDDPVAFVASKNIYRRHLNAKKKREAIAGLLKLYPEKSNRQIAEMAKASPTTVGKERAKLEAKGDVSKLDTRRDTKGRKQPARKPAAKGNGTRNPQHLLDAADALEAQGEAEAAAGKNASTIKQQAPKGEAIKPAPALKRLCDEIKIVVEWALVPKRGNKEHYAEVFAKARACIDEMERAWGTTIDDTRAAA